MTTDINKQIPQGYKLTEVGIIPEDWDVKTLGEVAEIVGGGTPSTSILNYWNGEIDWYTPTEIGLHKYTFSSTRKITKDGFVNCSAKMLPKGAILLTSRAAIGDASILMREGCTNQGFQSLIAKKNYDHEYLYYVVLTLKKALLQNASGSTFLEINPSKIKQIPIAIPIILEQQRIAQILSDADMLLQHLDALIAKKQAIKQGTMQELLRPKEGWEVKTLGEVAEVITKGTTPTSIGKEFQHRGVSFIKIESLEKSGKVIPNKVAFIDKETHLLLKRSQLRAKDIVFSIAGALGRVAIIQDDILPANTNQALAIIRLGSDSILNYEYLFYVLVSEKIQRSIFGISVQGAQPNLSLLNIYQFEIFYPPLSEQNHIAQILSDMDKELEQLEAKRAKYAAIKTGLMQSLLTGAVRV